MPNSKVKLAMEAIGAEEILDDKFFDVLAEQNGFMVDWLTNEPVKRQTKAKAKAVAASDADSVPSAGDAASVASMLAQALSKQMSQPPPNIMTPGPGPGPGPVPKAATTPPPVPKPAAAVTVPVAKGRAYPKMAVLINRPANLSAVPAAPGHPAAAPGGGSAVRPAAAVPSGAKATGLTGRFVPGRWHDGKHKRLSNESKQQG